MTGAHVSRSTARSAGVVPSEVLAYDGVSKGRRDWLERLAERVKATYARAIVVYHLWIASRGI